MRRCDLPFRFSRLKSVLNIIKFKDKSNYWKYSTARVGFMNKSRHRLNVLVAPRASQPCTSIRHLLKHFNPKYKGCVTGSEGN